MHLEFYITASLNLRNYTIPSVNCKADTLLLELVKFGVWYSNHVYFVIAGNQSKLKVFFRKN